MDKKEISITLLIAGISILFAFASFALFLSKGKSSYWTAKKMKFGAMLLTFTALTGLSSCDDKGEVMCYATAETVDWVDIDNYQEELNLKESNIVKGKIEYRSSDIYYFKMQNTNDSSIFQTDQLIPKDGSFNDSTELFEIKLDTALQSGKYTLSIYNVHPDSVPYSVAEYHFILQND